MKKKYIKGYLKLGNLEVPFTLFPNEKKAEHTKQPDFIGSNGTGAAWINEYEAKDEPSQ